MSSAGFWSTNISGGNGNSTCSTNSSIMKALGGGNSSSSTTSSFGSSKPGNPAGSSYGSGSKGFNNAWGAYSY